MEVPKHLEAHFKQAKVITGLKHGDAKDDFHFEPHGTTVHVAHFPHPGVICAFKLGSAGLQYQRGETLAVIPLQELIALFERVEPMFNEPPMTEKQLKAVKEIPSKVVAQASKPSPK